MMQTQRYDWADFMRGTMMFLVVLYHSEVYYGPGHSWSWVFEPFFLSGFFFISGFLFTKDINQINLTTKLKQIFRSIIFPYFVFVTVMAVPKVILGHSNIQQIFIDIIMLRASWFVIAIAVMQIIYSLILIIKPTVKNLIISTGVIFILGYSLVVIYRDIPDWLLKNPWLQSKDLPNRLPACVNLAFVQSPFFALGILFRCYRNKISEKIINNKFFIISILLYIVVYIYIDHNYIGSSMCVVVNQYNNILFIFLIGVIGIWGLMCLSFKIKVCKPINYIGRNSILFYFLNGAMLTILPPLMNKITFMDSYNYLCQFIVAVIATITMFPCVWFINKYLPILNGNKDSFNKMSKIFGLKIVW